MKKRTILDKQTIERNKNVRAGEILTQFDKRYMVITDQEVLTGDIMIVDLNDDGSFEKYGESQQIINVYDPEDGWKLKG